MAYEKAEWRPVTGLGRLVASGEIKSIDQVLESGRPIKEPEIVDMFLPDLEDEVLDIAMMQRMTDWPACPVPCCRDSRQPERLHRFWPGKRRSGR